jgi:hypothetical protein
MQNNQPSLGFRLILPSALHSPGDGSSRQGQTDMRFGHDPHTIGTLGHEYEGRSRDLIDGRRLGYYGETFGSHCRFCVI